MLTTREERPTGEGRVLIRGPVDRLFEQARSWRPASDSGLTRAPTTDEAKMLTIETQGSWSEMGRAYGATFAEPLRRCMGRFLAFLPADAAAVSRASAVVSLEVRWTA